MERCRHPICTQSHFETRSEVSLIKGSSFNLTLLSRKMRPWRLKKRLERHLFIYKHL